MEFIIALAFASGFAGATAELARRKNREVVAWAILGALAPLLALIVLACHSYLCSCCRNPLTEEEAKTGACPHCGPTSQLPAEVMTLDLSQRWRFEPRRLDDCRGTFTLETEDGQPFIDCLVEFFEGHRDPSLGRFCTAELASSRDGERWQLLLSIDFAPFEQEMSQDVELVVRPQPPSLAVEFSIRRTSGNALRWWEYNHNFMNALRRAILKYQASVQ